MQNKVVVAEENAGNLLKINLSLDMGAHLMMSS